MAKSKDSDVFNMHKLDREIREIAKKKDYITDAEAENILETVKAINSQMRKLQYFCAVIFYYNKFHLFEKTRIFPLHTAYVDRLKKAHQVVNDENHLKALINNMEVPQYPSIFLFAISFMIITKRCHTTADYNKLLGEAWLNMSNDPFCISSAPTSTAMFEDSQESYDGETEIDRLVAKAELFLFRLKSTEEFILNTFEGRLKPYDGDKPNNVWVLFEAIKKLRSFPESEMKKQPLSVFDHTEQLLHLAALTKDAELFNEVLDACKNYNLPYQK